MSSLVTWRHGLTKVFNVKGGVESSSCTLYFSTTKIASLCGYWAVPLACLDK